MKKLFVLMLSLGAVTSIFAQRREGRDVILGQSNNGVYNNSRHDNDFYNTRDRDAQIARIRQQYNWKINSVENDRYLRRSEKKRIIRSLERERDAKIREVWQRSQQRSRSYGRY